MNKTVKYEWCGYLNDEKSATPYTIRQVTTTDYCKVASVYEAQAIIAKLEKLEALK
jgi:hypothetical protein